MAMSLVHITWKKKSHLKSTWVGDPENLFRTTLHLCNLVKTELMRFLKASARLYSPLKWSFNTRQGGTHNAELNKSFTPENIFWHT